MSSEVHGSYLRRCAVKALTAGLLSCLCVAASANPVQDENALPGTNQWQLTKPSAGGEIQGYAGQDSLAAGDRLDLCVSTSSPRFELEIFRLGYYKGQGGALKMQVLNLPGLDQGHFLISMRYPSDINQVTGLGGHSIVNFTDVKGQATNVTDARWKVSYSITVPSSWVTGIYVAKLTESATGTQWHIPFVVRDDYSDSEILCEIPFNTDQAYNFWGGASAYSSNRPRPVNIRDRATYLCYNRPYLFGSGTQNMFFWEYPLARFLEEMGIDVSYTTNMAIASGMTDLNAHYGLAVAGHDEYVSQNERFAIESGMKNGLSVAFFGANNMYWQTREATDFAGARYRSEIVYKDSVNNAGWVPHYDPMNSKGPLQFPVTTDLWTGPRVGDPERKVTGADYAGEVQEGLLYDFVASDVASWVFQGSGLHAGDHIPGLVGDEVDTLNVVLAKVSGTDQVFHTISASPFLDPYGRSRTANSILIEHPLTNNFVFDAGAMFWNARLTDFPSYLWTRPASECGGLAPMKMSPALRAITRNVLFHLAHGLNGKNL